MSSAVRAIARNALTAAVAAVLGLSTLAAAAATSVDELIAMRQRAWGDEPELLAEVYAPEGVHTATFYDRTNEYTGPAEIAGVAGLSIGAPELIGPRIDLPAPEGEWRWADFSSLGSGTACLNRAVDGQLVRHDCFVPSLSTEIRPLAAVVDDAAIDTAIEEIGERLDAAWSTSATLDDVAAVYAPDAVHSARYPSRTRTYAGPEQIALVALSSTGVDQIAGPVVFEAPEGELAWASVADPGIGASVCLFRARDGMVFRHDCVLPISS